MAFVKVNPCYRELLARLGLRAPDDFLALPGVIYCGHPDRHVARVALGTTAAFLKREHRVRWKDRLASAWAGFGFVPRASREYRLLRDLAAAGIACSEAIAVGSDGRGRAFLLLREVGGRDLRAFLERAPARLRRLTAVRLGEALARIHAAGFDHPDLYSKHILVSRAPGHSLRIHFLDWQRSCRRRTVSWAVRRRDLAALDATLAEELAGSRDRLACLRAYRRAAGAIGPPRLGAAARSIRRRADQLVRRRRIRELRQPPLAWGRQNLVWLDGEALCVTRAFRAELRGRLPEWLAPAAADHQTRCGVSRTQVERSGGRQGLLIRRHQSRPLAWLCAWLRGRRLVSPELEQAGLLFRLQRYGVATPRLLAVGQKHVRPWRTDSLLLLEPLQGTVPLAAWLASQGDGESRRLVLRRAAEVLRRLHDAGCSFAPATAPVDAFHVRAGDTPEVVLGTVEGLRKRCTRTLVMRDLAALWAGLGATCRRTERLWFLLGYLDVARLTPAARRLAARLLRLARAGGGREPPEGLPAPGTASPSGGSRPPLADESAAGRASG
jgi:tRNA A-37 threonylcarbamoyl transferase component Bud32